MQAQWKLSRAYGIANLMVIHRLSDLDAVGDASSQPARWRPACSPTAPPASSTARRPTNSPGTTAALGLTVTEQDLLGDLGVGEGLWRIGRRGFVVQHQLTAGELDIVDTRGRNDSHEPQS